MVRLHVEPHLGAGAKRAFEAERHRCADAGTSVQQRGQSLPGNAEALRDLSDRYAVGEILAEDLAVALQLSMRFGPHSVAVRRRPCVS